MTVLLSVVAAMLTADAVYTAFRMFNLFGLMSASIAVEATTIIICLIFAVFSILLLTIRYKISNDFLTLNLGTIDLLGKKVSIGKILNIVFKKEENKLYLSYLGKGEDPTIVQVMIAPSKFKEFTDYLMTKNSGILYFGDSE